MATNKITYTLDFKANFKDVQGQLTSLKNSLNTLVNMKLSPGQKLASDINAASNAAVRLKGYLSKALDPSTGKLDLSRLNTQMKLSGDSAQRLATNLLRGGQQGAKAFLQVSNAILNSQKPMMRLNTLTKNFVNTLKNTVRWQLSSDMLRGLTSTLSDSLQFAKELDRSLNNIRIVTGASRDEMERFTTAANETAKALSTSTKKYADATLIYRQQGDSASEARRKAEITIKAANAAGTEAKEMSEYLTGIWNSYQVGAGQLELFVDKLVKVGVVTATSSEELATSMTKVAATANAVGVSYDQLLSTLATVSSATRLSSEQIGTAFKTIYARIGDLELKGSIDEDGVTTTLGTISSQLKQVGVDILDAQGNINDMGSIIEDLGSKWQTMSANEKTAIAEAVAGKRQYTQLFALFENWPEYQRTLKEAGDAQGELNKQQAIYADSIEGAKARLGASKEDLILELVNRKTIQDTIDFFATVTEGLTGIIKAADGIKPIFMALSAYLLQKFAPQISTKMVDVYTGIIASIPIWGRKASQQFLNEWLSTFNKVENSGLFNSSFDKMELKNLKEMTVLKAQMEEQEKYMTEQKKRTLSVLEEELKAQKSLADEQARLTMEEANRIYRNTSIKTSILSGYTGKQAIKNETFDVQDFKNSSAFKDLGSAESAKLLENLTSAEVPLQHLVQNFSLMNSEAQELVLHSLAKYFNDGLVPSEQMKQSLLETFNASMMRQEAENEVVLLQAQNLQNIAMIKTEMTGVLHIYDEQSQEIREASEELERWTQVGGDFLIKQREIKNSIQETRRAMGETSDSANRNKIQARERVSAYKDSTYTNLVDSKSDKAKVASFVGTLRAGNEVGSKQVANLEGVIDQLRKTSQYSEGAKNAISRLVDAFDLVKQSFEKTNSVEDFKNKIEQLKITLNETGKEIRELTMDQTELFNSKAGFDEDYINKIYKEKQAYDEANAALKENIELTERSLQEEQSKSLKSREETFGSSAQEKYKASASKSSQKYFAGSKTNKTGGIDALMQSIASGGKDAERSLELLKEKLEALQNKDEVFKNMLDNIKKFENEAKNSADRIKELNNDLDKLKGKNTPEPKREPPKPQKDEDPLPGFKDKVQSTTQVVGSLGQVMMSSTMMVSSFMSAFEKDASPMQTFMGIAMGITNALSLMNGVTQAVNAAQAMNIIFTKAKTKAIEAETKATYAQITAEKTRQATNMAGWVMLAASAVIALTAGVWKYISANKAAVKEQKKFEEATKRLEDTQKEIAEHEEEISSLEDLSKRLEEASKTKENLADVTKDLNKAVGVEFDLLNGGSKEYARANSLLQARLELKKKELEKDRERAKEDTKIRLNTITGKTSGKGSATSSDLNNAQVVKTLQWYANLSPTEREKFDAGEGYVSTIDYGGKLGKESIGINEVKDIFDRTKEAFKDYGELIEDMDMPILDLQGFLEENLLAGEMNIDQIDKFVSVAQDEKDALEKAIQIGDSEEANAILEGMAKYLPENMQNEWKLNTNDIITTIKNSNKAVEIRNRYNNTEVVKGLSNFSEGYKKITSLMENWGSSNGQLDSSNIISFIEEIRKLPPFTEDTEYIEGIQNMLLDPILSKKDFSVLMGDIVKKLILNNEDIKNALADGDILTLIDKLEENGIVNAKEFANQLMLGQKAVREIQEVFKDFDFGDVDFKLTKKFSKDMIDSISVNLQKLQNEYGYTKESAEALILTEAIFNNQKLDVDEKISALKSYNEEFKLSNSIIGNIIDKYNLDSKSFDLSKLSNQALKDLGIQVENGVATYNGKEIDGIKDIFIEEMASIYSLKAEREYYVQLSNQSKAAREKLIKEHNEDIEEWRKEDSLAKVEDRIEEFTLKITQKQREIDSLDWKLELFGEGEEVGTYLQKAELMAEKASMLVDEFHQLSEIEPISADEATAVATRMTEIYEEWMSTQKEMIEQEQELTEKAATNLIEVLTKEYEVITATIEAMTTLLQINMKRNSQFSAEREKNSLLKLLGQTLNSVTEEEKEENKKLKARSKLNKKILELDQEMITKIKDLETKALEDGIAEREKERKKELEDIERDFKETLVTLETTVNDSTTRINQIITPVLNEALNKISMITNFTNGEGTTTYTYNKDEDRSYTLRKTKGAQTMRLTNLSGAANLDHYTIGGIDRKQKIVTILARDKDGNVIDVFNYDIGSNDKSGQILLGDDRIGKRIEVGEEILSASAVYTNKFGYKNEEFNKWTANNTKTYAPRGNMNETQQAAAGGNFNKNNPFNFGKPSVRKGSYYDIEFYSKNKNNNGKASHAKFIDDNGQTWIAKINPDGNYAGALEGNVSIWDPGKISFDTLFLDATPQYAKGSDSTPAGEAFVGEKGRELILLPDGKIVLAGQDGMELANLPQGARVLTNEETEKILRNKKDYANLVLSQGNQIAFERYEDGISDGLQSEDFIADTSDLSAEFYSEELEKQKEHDKNIKEELDTHNKQIETDEKQHNSNLETITKNHTITEQNNLKLANNIIKSMTKTSAQEIESLINNMKLVMPGIDSKEFIESLEKLVDESLSVVYKDQDITITDKHGKTHTGTIGGEGDGESANLSGTGTIRGKSVEIGKGITDYDAWFVKYGEEFGVDPRFLKAICGIETNYGQNKNTSGAGAKGLMQFIDSTAKAYGVDVSNDESSIKGAAKYLSKLLTRYHGNLVLAGRAYNGGRPLFGNPENDKYGKMLEDCFGLNTTNDDIKNGLTTKVSSFIDLLKVIGKKQIDLPSKNGWIDPLEQISVISPFGPRTHPITGKRTNHNGIDLNGAYGDPIYATKDGVVITNTYQFNGKTGYGNWLQFKTNDGYIVGYGHMKDLSKYQVGDRVKQGDIIGYVGSSGGSTGPHLDYHVMKDGKYIDPKNILPSYARGGATKQENALVGEYGREIILYPDGTAGLLGENGMEFAELPAGAQIIPNQETERILQNPVNYKVPSYANGTFEWNKEEIEQEAQNIKKSASDKSKAQLFSGIIYQIENFNNISPSDRMEFLNQQSSIATANALETRESVSQYLMGLINNYNNWKLSTGQEDKAFEAFIGEMFTTLVEETEKVFSDAEEKIEQQRELFLADLKFDQNVRTITGSWTAEDDFINSIRSFHNLLELFPKDIDRINEGFDTIISQARAYMDAYLDEFNRQYEEKIKLEEYEKTRLESLKTLQESINKETNSYRSIMHDINKELNNSRISTKWLDKTQKEYLFNEKDYLAVSEKVAKVRSEALQDWENTQEIINRLSNDELYKAQYLNEAYKERSDIREKELNVLREELNLQKKQMALNEALMERNVRVFSGGRWRQIANVENVRKAQEDLDETIYQIQTQQLELDQQEEINTLYNTRIRESSELIDKWNKTMELASEQVSEAFRLLTDTVDISGLSLSSFGTALDKVITAIENERKRLEQNGIKNGVSQEDFNNNYTNNSGKTVVTIDGKGFSYADLILTAKKQYDNASSDFEREQAHANAESWREQALAEGGVAAEIAVKSKNWTAEQMNKYINKNAAGTRDSTPGLSLVNEKGVEMLSTKYGQIIELNPHQKIFNNDQMNFLYDLSREGISGMNRTVSAISNSMQDNSLLIEHLEVKLDNVTDAKSFAEELQGLTSYIRNTKTIQGRSSR